MNNILARVEASKSGAEDAIMMNSWGQLTEATTSNLFFVVDGQLLTPEKKCGILSGITREKIIQISIESQAILVPNFKPKILFLYVYL